MLKCIKCFSFFFEIEGLKEHDKYCIGYCPNEVVNVKRKRKIFM